MMKNKVYLGDGVYLEKTRYELILTTENGYEVTNTIHLETDMCLYLLHKLKQFLGETVE